MRNEEFKANNLTVEEKHVLELNHRDHIITNDEELIEFARKASNDWYDSGWHTGTPTEIGFYLVTTSYENYFVRFFNGVNFYRHPRALKIIAWQKIEPYKEKV